MIHLDINDSERQVLYEVLKSQLSDLSYEIANTDKKDFRDELKAKRDLLQKVVNAIESAAAA